MGVQIRKWDIWADMEGAKQIYDREKSRLEQDQSL